MHTKKTNNTNKLMQISYHFALTKIQKLQNLKNNNNNNKKLFSVPIGTPGIARNWPVWPIFKPVRNVDVSIPLYIPVRYIPAYTAGTDTILTSLT